MSTRDTEVIVYTDSNQHLDLDQLWALAQGEPDDIQKQRMKRHFAICDDCDRRSIDVEMLATALEALATEAEAEAEPCPDPRLLERFTDGDALPGQWEKVNAHLADCQ